MNHKSKGFTLIEIIVVLIILGVLAAIAVPTYFSWIKRSYISEALISLSQYKGRITVCILTHPGLEYTSCNGAALGIVDSDNFSYTASGTDGSPMWAIIAMPISGNRAGLGSWDTVLFSGNALSGSSSCSGAGVFQGPC